MTLTIRQLEERRKERHGSEDGLHCCVTCGWNWPCPDYADAVAALRALDEATKGEESHPGLEGFRLVLDRTQPNEKLETPPDPAPPTENT